MNLSGLNSLKTPASERLSARTAEAVVDRWHQAQPAPERERLQRWRRLSERDAASQFAQLLQLRPSLSVATDQRAGREAAHPGSPAQAAMSLGPVFDAALAAQQVCEELGLNFLREQLQPLAAAKEQPEILAQLERRSARISGAQP